MTFAEIPVSNDKGIAKISLCDSEEISRYNCRETAMHDKQTIKDFESRFVPITESGCWIWLSGCVGDGYGVFWHNKKQNRAHRFSYELYKGEIPNGAVVCHKCDTPACVNPEHLFAGTHADNSRDMCLKGRTNPVKGQDNHMAKLSDSDVLSIRSDTRPQSQIASSYNVNQSLVSLIKNRKRWRHL